MEQESWMNQKWRPAMAWMYMVICILDFAIFPIMWSILQAVQEGNVTSQWDPLTLKGAGLFHMAMGAVLGIAAWSRGREKIASMNNGYYDSYEQQYTTRSPLNTRPTHIFYPEDPTYRNTRND